MKQVTLTMSDKKYPLFMEMVKKLDFIKKVETTDELTDGQILQGIKQAVEEVKLVKAGKLKPRPLKELLDEL